MQFGWHWLPNILTLIRFALIVPFAMALYRGESLLALSIFVLAALSDGADGFLARRFGWSSRFGAIADPLADKALLVTTYAVMALSDLVPDWLLLLIILRDLVIVAGGVGYHFLIGAFHVKPTWLGKANTFVQILFVVILMAGNAGLPLPDGVISVGIGIVALAAVLSGSNYVAVWGARAWREKKQ